ncbi:MAG: DUF1156 domain-containing protein [Halapricum sp.]
MTGESKERGKIRPVAIEGTLPLKAVGIENMKEANPKHMPPHRYLHPWFARRPTAASRLAVLASVLPHDISHDDILNLMQIKPNTQPGESVSDYVIRKKSGEDGRSGTLSEHYEYPRPFTRSPTNSEVSELHSTLRDTWDGEVPAVFDPTAGGGVIPFESLRYGLPTIANELNPVPSVILKVMLQYAPDSGSLKQEIDRWAREINETAADNLSQYFPSENSEQKPSHYACTYSIECSECGYPIPLVKKWWLHKRSSGKGIAIRPSVSEDEKKVTYSLVQLPDDVTSDEFDPSQGPRGRGGATECLNCQVVTEAETVRRAMQSGNFSYELYGVKYSKISGGSGFRAPTEKDRAAIEQAADRVNSDYALHDLLNVERYVGDEDRAAPYGVVEWRDAYSPRQLITHYEYYSAFQDVKGKIKENHDETTAEAILSLLALTASKAVDRNIRFAPFDTSKGYPANAVGGKHFTLQWSFVDNNLANGDQSYLDIANKITNSYEELVNYLENVDPDPAEVLSEDASDISLPDQSVQAVVIDPPYYDSIIYSEMADVFYVWLKKYLEDVHPSLFEDELTDKSSEAVANAAEYEDLAGGESTKKELATQDYEDKMGKIFSELYRTLQPGGVMTVMFTHKESSAWDTLTTALINSGFVITSTHPITSEMPQRTDTRGGGSADSTLLLTGRKPHSDRDLENKSPSLWTDVKSDTRKAAKGSARDLIDSELNLTKTDVIISAFGPTLRVFADAYPVVDDEDNPVPPRRALEEAREAVTQVLVDEYLEAEGIEDLDDVTKWYILSWLVHERETFSYDEGHQLGLGIGVDIDDIKRSTKTWRKSRGDISLRGHSGRVQNINEKPENRSSRTPVNPDDLSFGLALDKVHAAMHVYDVQGENTCCDWLRERNFDSDSMFKATLKALLQVLPKDHEDWELARDLAVGRTRNVLELDFSPSVFADDGDNSTQTDFDDY